MSELQDSFDPTGKGHKVFEAVPVTSGGDIQLVGFNAPAENSSGRQLSESEQVAEGKKTVYGTLAVASTAGLIGSLKDPGAFVTLLFNVLRNCYQAERLNFDPKKRYLGIAMNAFKEAVTGNHSETKEKQLTEEDIYTRDEVNNAVATAASVPLALSYPLYSALGWGSAMAAEIFTGAGICMMGCYLLRMAKCRMDRNFVRPAEEREDMSAEVRETVAENNMAFSNVTVKGEGDIKFVGWWDKTGSFFKKLGYDFTRYAPALLMLARAGLMGYAGLETGGLEYNSMGSVSGIDLTNPLMISSILFMTASWLTWDSDTGNDVLARFKKQEDEKGDQQNKLSEDSDHPVVTPGPVVS